MRTKNQPRLSLTDLLRRRKMTLLQFLDESGITTYEKLVIHCDRMGVNPPAEELFRDTVGSPVSSPTEGVVILEPLPVVDEQSGDRIDVDETPRPRRRKKTETISDE